MIAAWMIHAIFVSALVALAARAVESLGRSAGVPVRRAWGGALAMTLLLAGLAPLRVGGTGENRIPVAYGGTVARSPVPTPRATWMDVSRAAIESARRAIAAPIAIASEAATKRLSPNAAIWIAFAWASLSASLLLLLAMVHLRLSRARRGWPAADVQGVHVRVSPRTGPAVIGIVRPEVVVPRWLLLRAPDEQRLVVAHEREHVRARDPLLLAFGCIVVALLPWNPAVWWMLSRLRLTMELDCDARVLSAGATPRSYGTLLIDVAEQCAGLRVGVPALADDSTHLKERLIAMTTTPRRFALARGTFIAAVAVVALAAACEAPLPTSAEVERMNAAGAEREAMKFARAGEAAGPLEYRIDGERASAERARAIPASEIAAINVVKSSNGGSSTISITTRAKGLDGKPLVRLRRDGSAGVHETIGGPVVPLRTKEAFLGLVFVDGVQVSAPRLSALRPDEIESVEVIKGAAATERYTQPEAVNGVIVITTRRAGAAPR